MTAQELKNSILQLAIQGELVPQNIDDEPASELLKRIANERMRRITNGTLIVDKKHTADPITEDDILYDLPDTWMWARFADIVTFNSGKTPQRQNANYWSGGKHPWVSIADMQADSITVTTKECISELALDECFSGRLSPAGTMIMSFKLTIGKISILGMDAVHNEAIISIYPTAAESDCVVLQKYLFKILPLVAATGNSKNAIKGKTLNATSLSNLMIPVPPLAEQERIVAKIEELLPLIEEYDKAEQKLSVLNANFPEMLRKSILQQAVQGKLTARDPSDEPASELLKRIQAEKAKLIVEGKIKKEKPMPEITEDEVPFDIPDSWKWVHFADVLDVRDGTHDTPKYVTSGIPLVTSKNLVDGGIDFETTKLISIEDAKAINMRSAVDDGDILFAMIGTIGNPVFVKKEREFCIKNMALFKAINQKLISMEYLLLFLQNEQHVMKKKASGGVQSFVSLKFLRNYLLPFPPLAEQQRIVDRVNELLAVCDGIK